MWVFLSAVFLGTALFATMGILASAQLLLDSPHAVRLVGWSLIWGSLSLAGVPIAYRLAFGFWVAVSGIGLALAAAGVVLAAAIQVVLQQWAVARFGYYEPELIGWTAGLFAVLIGLATATFGAFLAHRGSAAWPLAFVLLGSAGVVFILMGNLPGLADGLAADSWPLAAWLTASGLYAAVVTAATLIRALHPPATHER